MRRPLSNILIGVFFLLAPVSFASEAIPDFEHECQVISVCQVRRAVSSLDGSRPGRVAGIAARRERITFPRGLASLPPYVEPSRSPFSDRAPPA